MDEKNRVIQSLRDFVKENFVRLPYWDQRPIPQKSQYQLAFDFIKSIYDDNPKVLQELLSTWSDCLIPTIEEVGGIRHMENIGISANKCLQELKANRDRNRIGIKKIKEDPVFSVLEQFLMQVKWHAQRICSEEDRKQTTQEELINLINERINPLLQDATKVIQTQRNELDELYQEKKTELELLRDTIKASAQEAQNSAAKAETHAKQVLSDLEDAKTAADKATSAATEAKDTAKEMLPNMLSALGILVGIVVAVVGCYLSILLAEHSNDIKSFIGYSRPFEFARYLLMGQTTTMVVFLLMYLISRISGHTLSCSCNRFDAVVGYDKSIHDCTKCTRKCGVQKRFVWRYPYLFGINFACCVGYVVLAIWQFINIYFRESLDNWIISLGFWRCLQELIVLILLLTVATVTVVAIIVFAYQLIKWILSLMKS